MWTNFSQLAQGLREQATAAVHNAGLDEQLVSRTLIALETLLLTTSADTRLCLRSACCCTGTRTVTGGISGQQCPDLGAGAAGCCAAELSRSTSSCTAAVQACAAQHEEHRGPRCAMKHLVIVTQQRPCAWGSYVWRHVQACTACMHALSTMDQCSAKLLSGQGESMPEMLVYTGAAHSCRAWSRIYLDEARLGTYQRF